MARTKGQFVSSFGTAFEIFKALSDEVAGLGGNDDELRKIISDESLRRQLAYGIRNRQQEEEFSVVVNYGRSVLDMVQDGDYEHVNGNLESARFSTSRMDAVMTKLVLVRLNRSVCALEARNELWKSGLRPANLQELLAFGNSHPDKPRESMIMALDTMDLCSDVYLVATLKKWTNGLAILPNCWYDLVESAQYRFLAVRDFLAQSVSRS